MPRKIHCEFCHQMLVVADSQLGKKVQCPGCHATFEAPLPSLDATAADESLDDGPTRATRPRTEVRAPRRRRRFNEDERSGGRLPRRPVKHFPTGLVVALVGGAALLVLAIVVAAIRNTEHDRFAFRPMPVPFVPPAQPGRRRDPQNAFANNQGVPANEFAQELKPLFEDFGEAITREAHIQQGDAVRGLAAQPGQKEVAEFFDTNRLFEEILANSNVPVGVGLQRNMFIMEGGKAFDDSFRLQTPILQWISMEIKSVNKLPSGDLVVIVRHRQPLHASMKMRWWLSNRTGTWKIYDFEDLDFSLRASLRGALLMNGNGADTVALGDAIKRLADARLAIVARHNFAEAQMDLEATALVPLPPELESLRLYVKSLIQMQHNELPASIASLLEAKRNLPDMWAADLLLSVAYNRQGQFAKALTALENYRKILGADTFVSEQIGVSLRGLNRRPEAAAAYRDALDDDPTNVNAVIGLTDCLPFAEPHPEIAERFAKLGDLEKHFVTVAEECRKVRDGQSLVAIASVMKDEQITLPVVDLYYALGLAWTRQYPQALSEYRLAVAKPSVGVRNEQLVRDFLQSMSTSGFMKELYEANPDRRAAFRAMASGYHTSYQVDALADLVKLHADASPDDPLLSLYRGFLSVNEGDYPAAESYFSAGLKAPPDAKTLASFRTDRVTTAFYTGKGIAAYKELDNPRDTFSQLLRLYRSEGDDAGLETLLNLRAQDAPDDHDLWIARIQLLIRKGQFPEATKVFQAALAKKMEPYNRESLLRAFLVAMVDAKKPLDGLGSVPDTETAFRIMADELVGRDDMADLDPILEYQKAQHPGSALLAYYTGERFAHDKQWSKAADQMALSVRKPSRPEDGFRMQRRFVYVMHKAKRDLEVQAILGSGEDFFNQMADLTCRDGQAAELEKLVAQHRAVAGDSNRATYYEARAKNFAKDWPMAAALLDKAYQREPAAWLKQMYVTQFATDWAKAGRAAEAIEVAPDKAVALRALANYCVTQKKPDELQKLLLACADYAVLANEIPFYQGELHLLRGEPAEALAEFRQDKRGSKFADDWLIRSKIMLASIRAGQIEAAYKEKHNAQRDFESLANICLDEKNSKQLEVLVGLRRQERPDDPNFGIWEIEVAYLNGDYESCVSRLKNDIVKLRKTTRWQFRADDLLVRSLVKLKRFPDAITEAERLTAKKGEHVSLLILAHASTGDAKATLAAFDNVGADRLALEDCYRDAELGAILRSDAFQEFRERHPEPEGTLYDDVDDDDFD